jgi:Zn-dependent peptidase ImmA (M78 family)
MSPFVPFSDASKLWEPRAEELRRLIPQPSRDILPFDPWLLAPKVGLRVAECNFAGLTEAEKAYMHSLRGGHWSGGFVPTILPDGTKLCMLNPDQSYRRQKITLMEEIAHSFLGHSPTILSMSGESRYRDFNKRQEQEAYGVGAAVLLPWRLFFPMLNGGDNLDCLSEAFDVTRELVRYRIKVCGASSLYSKRQRNSSREAVA